MRSSPVLTQMTPLVKLKSIIAVCAGKCCLLSLHWTDTCWYILESDHLAANDVVKHSQQTEICTVTKGRTEVAIREKVMSAAEAGVRQVRQNPKDPLGLVIQETQEQGGLIPLKNLVLRVKDKLRLMLRQQLAKEKPALIQCLPQQLWDQL